MIRENAPVICALIIVTIEISATTMITTEITLFSTVPSVRVRCTIRAALTGEASSACVSCTFRRRFAPVTIRLTVIWITRFAMRRTSTAITMTIAIWIVLPRQVGPSSRVPHEEVPDAARA